MLDRVTAYEVIRQAKSGRTRPVLMLCEAETDRQLEVFCKLSAGCDEGVASLAREVVPPFGRAVHINIHPVRVSPEIHWQVYQSSHRTCQE